MATHVVQFAYNVDMLVHCILGLYQQFYLSSSFLLRAESARVYHVMSCRVVWPFLHLQVSSH
jgi:hypothetical protein